MSWTQPLCDDCWVRVHGAKVPLRIVEDVRVQQKCCRCGRNTVSGIYVRVDPATVPYPSGD